MPYDRVRSAKKKVTGAKQTIKAIEKGIAKAVFVAGDAEERVIKGVVELGRAHKVPVIEVESMAELGRACGIQVGAASAAIIEE